MSMYERKTKEKQKTLKKRLIFEIAKKSHANRYIKETRKINKIL